MRLLFILLFTFMIAGTVFGIRDEVEKMRQSMERIEYVLKAKEIKE